MLGRCLQPTRGQHLPHVKHACQIQRQRGKQHSQHRNHIGVLQLKAPAQLLATRTHQQQQTCQKQHANKHACTIGQATQAQATRVLGMPRKAQQLDGQHRKYARH